MVGCGGIGGITAAKLAERGVDVTAITGNAAIAGAIRARGARVRVGGVEGGGRGIDAHAALPAGAGPFDYALVATQPIQTEQVAAEIAPALAPGGRVVCIQNGLCEARAARFVGEARVVGGIVAWGASHLEPGLYERTAPGGFVLGYLDGHLDPALERLGGLLGCVGPIDLTRNLLGARWSKLAINCAISSLGAIGGERLGVLLRHRFVRRLTLELMSEAVYVARAERVRLEKVSGTLELEWLALTEAERTMNAGPSLVAKHSVLLAVGAKFRRLRSTMLSAIERGKPPSVDYLNGEITSRARAHGLEVPVNQAVQETVHRLARGEARPSLALARALYDETAWRRTEQRIAS